MKTPLFDKIAEYLSLAMTGFHTPGHQQGRGCSKEFHEAVANYILQMDLTELPGLDNLKCPQGCLREAQGLAAAVFDANETFFLLNGSTIGLQAAILAANRPPGKVVVPRQAHISLMNAFALSGGTPIIAPACVDYEWGLVLGTDAAALETIVAKNRDARAIVATHPSYQGLGGDLAQIMKIAEQAGIPLIVDEAHGAHLFFRAGLPLSAQRAKADIVVQSTHKTLGALTQASMLHVNRDKWREPVRRALDILQTTSPSYLLMASLDCVQARMAQEGAALAATTFELARRLTDSIAAIPGLRVLAAEVREPWQADPTKLVISAAKLGLSGFELAAILRQEYRIEAEMSDHFYVLFILTLGHGPEDADKLLKALGKIARDKGYKAKGTQGKSVSDLGAAAAGTARVYEEEIELLLTPRRVFELENEEIPLRHSSGRIAAAPVTVYPPGIPLIWPGQEVRPQHLDYLLWAQGVGFRFQGVKEHGFVSVIQE